jgi:hypothetical protein
MLKSFCQFMEKKWEKVPIDKKELFGMFGKDSPPSTSSKNSRSPEARAKAMDKARTPVRRVKLGEDFPGQATGASAEGNEQGVASAGSPTSAKSKKLKYPKKPEEIVKPVDTAMKEAFCNFMEDRSERRQADAKHSGKMEKGNVIWRRVKHTPTHIKRVGEWPDEVPSRSPINKAMKHGERQAVKRDIAKDPESV